MSFSAFDFKKFFYLFIYQFGLSRYANGKNNTATIRHWHSDGGVLICGYELFRIFAKNRLKKLSDADVLVCDEGHLLKNKDSKTYEKVGKVKTARKILLSGTPIQNNLTECKFIKLYESVAFTFVNSINKQNIYYRFQHGKYCET